WLVLGQPLVSIRSQAAYGLALRQPNANLVPLAPSEIAGKLWDLSLHLFPLTVVTAALLIIAFVVYRSMLPAAAAICVALNVLTTASFFLVTKSEVVLQLRYNMRP